MKQYPKITYDINTKMYLYVFDKLDGSNIRAEWSKKRGFYKFGTRKRLMDETDPLFGKAKNLIINKYQDDLEMVFKENRVRRSVCFFEFLGKKSFAGLHSKDDEHDVILFDVTFHPSGLIEPKDFIRKFGHLDIPKVLHKGTINNIFVNSVKNGTLPGMTYEGVICKGKYISPGLPLMFKIKNKEWVDKVKERYYNNRDILKEIL